MQKATEIAPPERGKVERALLRYDNGAGALPFIFQSWHGLHIANGNFPAGAGVKFGVGFTHDLGPARPANDLDRRNRVELDVLGAYGTRGYTRGAASLNIHHLAGKPLELRVGGQHYEFDQQDFFGFGQDTWESNRTNYMLVSTEAGGDLRWTAKLIEVAGGIYYLNPRIGSGTDSCCRSCSGSSGVPCYDADSFERAIARASDCLRACADCTP